MDKIQRCERLTRFWRLRSTFRANPSTFVRNLCTAKHSDEKFENTEEQTDDLSRPKQGSFATSFRKFAAMMESRPTITEEQYEPQTFSTLLRYSNFINLGDPVGKVVVGKIVNVVQNDLYIDFGWKFHCVCPRPTENPSRYTRGSAVIIQINDLELSTRFLGASTDLSILEADCTLLKLIKPSR